VIRGLASLVAAALAPGTPNALFGLPTMIRLEYPNCVSCHISPQGGGPLNLYGKGIDLAQSRKGGEYKPADGRNDVLSLGGRVEQDLCAAMSSQLTATTGGPLLSINRGRFFYCNVTTLGKGFRIAATVDGESDTTTRKTSAYDPSLRPGLVLVSTALLHYRPKEGLEFAVGRDALPQVLIIPDQTADIKARNRFGYYDVPTQRKLFSGANGGWRPHLPLVPAVVNPRWSGNPAVVSWPNTTSPAVGGR
jgi:hypothetical protein